MAYRDPYQSSLTLHSASGELPTYPSFQPSVTNLESNSINRRDGGITNDADGLHPAIAVCPPSSSGNRYNTLPLNDPDQENDESETVETHTLVGDRGSGGGYSDMEKGRKSSPYHPYHATDPKHFLSICPIDPSRLSKEQRKVYDGFDNYEIDKIDRDENWSQRLARWKEERRNMGSFNWFIQNMLDAFVRRGHWKLTIGISILIAIIVCLAVLQEKVVKPLVQPMMKIKEMKLGWLIVVAAFFVFSIPPLFGNEIICVLVGIGWPLFEGWGLACAGTALGELVVYWIFRALRRKIGSRIVNKSVEYACLEKVISQNGFWLALIIRYSTIPPHISTVLFGVARLPFLPYAAASILGLPRWLPHIFNGYYMKEKEEEDMQMGKVSTLDTALFIGAQVLFAILTIYSYHLLTVKIKAVKRDVKSELRARRAEAIDSVESKGLTT